MIEAAGVAGGAGTRRVREVPVGRRGRMCLGCGEHRPLYRVRGGPVRSDRQHTLCFRCRRSLRDRVRAWLREGSRFAPAAPATGADLLWQGAA